MFLKSLKSKIITIFLLILTLCYVAAWFYAADHLKKIASNFQYKNENTNLSFDKIEVSGFPFALEAELSDIRFGYHLHNSLIHLGLDFISDSVKLKTNILFTKALIKFPEQSSIIITNDDKILKFKIKSDEEHYLQLTEKSMFNTYKALAYLYTSNNVFLENLNLERIEYKSKGLNFIDADTLKEILTTNSALDLKIGYKSDAINHFAFKTEHLINILDNKYVNHNFKQFSSKIDISTKLKSYGEILSILAADFNIVNFKLDDFSLTLNGHAKNNKNDSKDNSNSVDLNLKIVNLQKLITQLINENTLSPERTSILQHFMKAATGEEEVNDAEIKIYNSKDNSIRVGNLDFINAKAYLHQFLTSN